MNNKPSDEELFEKGLSEILSNEPRLPSKPPEYQASAKTTPPRPSEPQKKFSLSLELIVRIVALLVTITLLILFALQITSR